MSIPPHKERSKKNKKPQPTHTIVHFTAHLLLGLQSQGDPFLYSDIKEEVTWKKVIREKIARRAQILHWGKRCVHVCFKR